MTNNFYPYQHLELANLPGELWEDLPGLDGYYRLSNFGRVKRLAFEIHCSNGQIRRMNPGILMPSLHAIKNNTVKDKVYFLRASVTMSGKTYRLSIARLVYYLFVKPFDLSDYSLVVLAKDGNGKNIRPSNLALASIQRKQQRIFERKRLKRTFKYSYDEFVTEGLIKSSNPYCRQISQYSDTGKRIATFPSAKTASQVVGISETGISAVLHGRQILCSGFGWAYGKASGINIKSLREKGKLNRKKLVGQKVSQYNAKGKRMGIYLSIADAARATGVHHSDISEAVNGKLRSAGGFIWKKGWGKQQIDLRKYVFGKQLRAQRRWKKVNQYNLGGKFIKTFPSVKSAAASLGITPSLISNVLGTEKTAKGFLWVPA